MSSGHRMVVRLCIDNLSIMKEPYYYVQYVWFMQFVAMVSELEKYHKIVWNR